jgi:hypothetical protein
MAKNKNTFEKRRREMKRMQKAQEKRERRFARGKASVESESPDGAGTEGKPESSDDQSVSPPSM